MYKDLKVVVLISLHADHASQIVHESMRESRKPRACVYYSLL